MNPPLDPQQGANMGLIRLDDCTWVDSDATTHFVVEPDDGDWESAGVWEFCAFAGDICVLRNTFATREEAHACAKDNARDMDFFPIEGEDILRWFDPKAVTRITAEDQIFVDEWVVQAFIGSTSVYYRNYGTKEEAVEDAASLAYDIGNARKAA